MLFDPICKHRKYPGHHKQYYNKEWHDTLSYNPKWSSPSASTNTSQVSTGKMNQGLSREEQLRIWLENKRKSQRKSTTHVRRPSPLPSKASAVQKGAATDSFPFSVKGHSSRPSPAASETDRSGQRPNPRMFGTTTNLGMLIKERTPSERRSLRTPVTTTDRDLASSSKRPVTDPRLPKATIGSGTSRSFRPDAINDINNRTAWAELRFRGHTETRQRLSTGTKSSTRTCPVHPHQYTPLSTKLHGRLSGRTLTLEVAMNSTADDFSFSPMTCSVQSSASPPPLEGIESPLTESTREVIATKDVENQNQDVENKNPDDFFGTLTIEAQKSNINFHRPPRRPLTNRSNELSNLTTPGQEEDESNSGNFMSTPDPVLGVSLIHHKNIRTCSPMSVSNSCRELAVENSCEVDGYALKSGHLFDWRENLSPEFFDQEHTTKRRPNDGSSLSSFPSTEQKLHHHGREFGGESSLVDLKGLSSNSSGMMLPKDVEPTGIDAKIHREDNHESRNDVGLEGGARVDEDSFDQTPPDAQRVNISSRRRRRRKSTAEFPSISIVTYSPMMHEKVGANSSPGDCENQRGSAAQYNSPLVHGEPFVLPTILEEKQPSGEQAYNVSEHLKTNFIVQELRDQVKGLLIERNRLRDRLYASNQDFQNRISPIQDLFEEVSISIHLYSIHVVHYTWFLTS